MILDLRPALRALILSDAEILAIVGPRVFPHFIPQGQPTPAIVYNRVSGSADYTLQGPSGLATATMQVDCWAADPDTASTLARLVRAKLDGFAGDVAFGSESPQAVATILGVFVDAIADEYEKDTDLYRERVDYRFVWGERDGA